VCSIKETVFKTLSESIQETVGVEYEVIKLDNNLYKVGIAEAYNIGAGKAKFPYLCFVHEDVKFVSHNWGERAINHMLAHKDIGAIGLAGSLYKSKVVSSWWQPAIDNFEPKRVNIIQHYKFSNKESEHLVINPLNELIADVACLDGVFIFVKSSIWKDALFDSVLLKGFHGYDLDFTSRVGVKNRNVVAYDILLEHFSEGSNRKDWFFDNINVHKKIGSLLPLNKSNVDEKIIRKAELGYIQHNMKLIEEYDLAKNENITALSYIIESVFALKFYHVLNINFVRWLKKLLIK
jgi:hypothetical protein